jgi:ribosome-binding protein aMBF1 (putative translation factor)
MKHALADGHYVSTRDLSDAVREARRLNGASMEQAADALGVSADKIDQAESQPYRALFKLRRKMLERFAGYTLDGPYYRIKRKGV